MWRNVALCWVFTAPALAGALVVAVLTTPQLAGQAELWLPIAALLGAAYGVPAARGSIRLKWTLRPWANSNAAPGFRFGASSLA